MAEFLTRLFTLALQGGALALVVIVLRLALKKAPGWVRPALWALVAARLILPITFETAFSPMPSADGVKTAVASIVSSPETPDPANEAELNAPAGNKAPSAVSPINGTGNKDTAQPAPSAPAYEAAANAAPGKTPAQADAVPAAEQPGSEVTATRASLPAVLTSVWVLGAAGVLTWGAVSFLRLKKRVRVSAPEPDGAYVCDAVRSPFLLGVLRPRIYLPTGLSDEARAHVLAHERAHIARCDPAAKLFAFLLLAVYWFQPLFWLSYALFCRDIEAACDERVVRSFSREARAGYAETLLSLSAGRERLSACPLAFGETNVKTRVKNVLSYKKPAFWLILLAIVLAAGAAVLFFTQRKPAAPSPSDETDGPGVSGETEPSSETTGSDGAEASETSLTPGGRSASIWKTEAEQAAWLKFLYFDEPYTLPDGRTLTRSDDGYVLTENGKEKVYSLLLHTPESVWGPESLAARRVFSPWDFLPAPPDEAYDYADHWVLTNDRNVNWGDLALGPASSYISPEKSDAFTVYEDYFVFANRAASFGDAPAYLEDHIFMETLTGMNGKTVYLDGFFLSAQTWMDDLVRTRADGTRAVKTEQVIFVWDYEGRQLATVPRVGTLVDAVRTPSGFVTLTVSDNGTARIDWFDFTENGAVKKWDWRIPDADETAAQRLVYLGGRLYVFGNARTGEGFEDVSVIVLSASPETEPEILFRRALGGADYDSFLHAQANADGTILLFALTQSRDGDIGLSPDGYGVPVEAVLTPDGEVTSVDTTTWARVRARADLYAEPAPDESGQGSYYPIGSYTLPDGTRVTVRKHLLCWYDYTPPYLDSGSYFTERVVTGYGADGTAFWQVSTAVTRE
ncbi:MAG: hypothetical protein IK104_11380 [Clostridia bacterium]|nr:hypothetical protein [Clostridia bacterium]